MTVPLTDPLNNEVLSVHEDKVMQLTGSCLCGEVSYEIDGPVRDVVNCFCNQCQKTSGHHVAATRANKDDIKIIKDNTLQWYECLPNVFRGFCNNCGGNLFWDNKKAEDNGLAIMAGSLDAPTNLKTIGNIFTEDASDYCKIPSLK
jgi:hypothetical protein